VIAALAKMLRPIQTRVTNLVARAVVQLVDDGRKLQLVQLGVGPDETRAGVERFQEYGFTSVPLPGSEAVVLFVGGHRDHGLVVAVDDRRYRMKDLQPGDVALYNAAGAFVLLKADGSIEVTAKAGSDVVLNGGLLNVARVTDTAGPWPIVGGNPFVKA
jgi:phage baseplate assembly protein V